MKTPSETTLFPMAHQIKTGVQLIFQLYQELSKDCGFPPTENSVAGKHAAWANNASERKHPLSARILGIIGKVAQNSAAQNKSGPPANENTRRVSDLRINDYYRPASVPDALKILQSGANTKILAGGTDLVIALRERHVSPDALLDLSGIKELKRIYTDSEGLHIGSMATFSQIEADPNVLKYCPMLSHAASQVGSPQIRNRATIGGNVANAATAADSLPSLLAMDAEALVQDGTSKRYVKVDDLLVGINKTTLKPGELIVEFRLAHRPDVYMDFEKIGRRKALAISRINLGVVLEFDGSAVKKAAVAVGAVGKRAYRAVEIEEFLVGKTLSEEVNQEAASLMDEIVARNLAGRSTTPYKRKIAAAVLARALEKALRGAAQ